MDRITFRSEGNKGFYSCGCKDEVIGGNYFIYPCSLECEVYKFAIEESKKQGNKISFMVSKKEL